jgi:2-hydroxychromene-2-carboxylate isomerase
VAEAAFYYDFNSPYAYLAAERIDDLIPDAAWKPIAFPILLAELGRLDEVLENLNTAPAVAEVSRRAAERGLPEFAPPESWPVQSWSLSPLRAALVAEEHGCLREFTVAAYRKVFAESRSLADVDNILAAAEEVGLDRQAVTEGIQRQEVKDRLKGHTEEAFARGVTGIPTLAIGDELFWGDDHLEQAAAAASR